MEKKINTKQLISLILRKNEISSLEGIEKLEMDKLTVLDLSENNIKKISYLGQIKNTPTILGVLDLHGNKIEDFSELNKFEAITEINLYNTGIEKNKEGQTIITKLYKSEC